MSSNTYLIADKSNLTGYSVAFRDEAAYDIEAQKVSDTWSKFTPATKCAAIGVSLTLAGIGTVISYEMQDELSIVGIGLSSAGALFDIIACYLGCAK